MDLDIEDTFSVRRGHYMNDLQKYLGKDNF